MFLFSLIASLSTLFICCSCDCLNLPFLILISLQRRSLGSALAAEKQEKSFSVACFRLVLLLVYLSHIESQESC